MSDLEKLMKEAEERMAPFKTSYPLLFKEIKYLSVGKGWHTLLHNLFSVLEHHIKQLPFEIQGELYLSQVKEKFGGLRVNMKETTPFIDGAIQLAESMSFCICEHCGKPGETRGGGYILTLCKPCHNKSEKRKKLNK